MGDSFLKKYVFIALMPLFLLFTTSGISVNKNTSFIVIEKNSRRILEGENYDEQMLVASTAKILTAITVIENYNLNEEVIITSDDTNEVGSKVYFEENDKVKRKDLIYALMLRSANDAASALSENNSEEFIHLMNETAKKIGMKNSVFENASGLDEREYNISTAYDMALLSAYASENDEFKAIASTHTYKCHTEKNSYSWTNKHKLVKSDEFFIWGKTGFTKKSRRVLISNYLMDDMDVIIVTINKSDDWNYHKTLIGELSDYTFITIFNKGVYDTKLDVTYYICPETNIIIPISDSFFIYLTPYKRLVSAQRHSLIIYNKKIR